MFKKLLSFFKIIDEVQIAVPIQREAIRISVKEEVKIHPEAEVQSEIIPKQRKIERKRKEIKDFDEYTQGYKKYCLEKTSNQHIMKTSSYKVIDRNDSTETFLIQGDAFITHAEHRMLRIESPYFVKYIQQEYNPITKMNENAYD